MSWWRKNDPRSEYEGRGVQENTIFPVGVDSLTAEDQLRLISITGQESDTRAKPDPYFWYGGVEIPESMLAPRTELEILDEADPY